jgi:hypothetical protein
MAQKCRRAGGCAQVTGPVKYKACYLFLKQFLYKNTRCMEPPMHEPAPAAGAV